MSYTGKYALAKHETLALKCEDLERQLEELRKAYNFNLDLLSKQKNELEEAREVIDNLLVTDEDKRWLEKILKEKGE